MKRTWPFLLFVLILFSAYLLFIDKLFSFPDEKLYITYFQLCSEQSTTFKNIISALVYNPEGLYAPGYFPVVCMTGLIFKTSHILILIQISLLSFMGYSAYKLKQPYQLLFFLLPSTYVFSTSLLREVWMLAIVFCFITFIDLRLKKYLILLLFLLSGIALNFRIPLGIGLSLYAYAYIIMSLNIGLKKRVIMSSIPAIAIIFAIGWWITPSFFTIQSSYEFISTFILDFLGLTSIKHGNFQLSQFLYAEKYLLIFNFYILWKTYQSKSKLSEHLPYVICLFVYWSCYFIFWKKGAPGAPVFGYRNFFPLLPLFIFHLREEIRYLGIKSRHCALVSFFSRVS